MSASPVAVLFDLDGTLIDSAPSILESYRLAFAACAVPPRMALDAHLIGPPLRQTLALIAGSDEAATLDRLAAAFRQAYDSAGYKATRPYAALQATLAALRSAGHRLFIVTNKRIAPTRLILEYLGVAAYFEGVHAADAYQPPLADKAAVIGAVLAEHGLNAQDCLYVGDTAEDGHAAAVQGLAFVGVAYGYGTPQAAAPLAVLDSLAALPPWLANGARQESNV